MKNYKHSKAFYDKAYREYSAAVTARGGVPLKRNNFEAAWNLTKDRGAKNVHAALVDSTLFETSYGTARAELRVLRSRGDTKTKLKDLRSMTTQDFAAMYRKDITATYNAAIAAGKTKKEARQVVSTFWFGSK